MQKYSYKPICEFQADDAIEGFYLMREPVVKTGKTGKPFLQFKLRDSHGEIKAVMWDYEGDLHETSTGKPIKVRGTVSSYKNEKQLVCTLMRAPRDDDNIDMGLLLPTAPIEPKVTYEQMFSLIESIQDPEYKSICTAILAKYREPICYIAAAKAVHHAFRHGFLMHTYFMMCMGDYLSQFYPFINRDLLVTGAFCHDIGKIKEYQITSYGLMTDYTVQGHLLGHLYMGAQEIAEIAKAQNVSEEKSLLLQHMLLSHHGKPEYGAAVMPKTAEAMLLSMIDDLDAKMELVRESLENQPIGMTESIWPLNYKLCKHN